MRIHEKITLVFVHIIILVWFAKAETLRKAFETSKGDAPAGSQNGRLDSTLLQTRLDMLDQCSVNEIYNSHTKQKINHLIEILQGEKKEFPTLLWIGCSLDRYQIRSMCNLLGGNWRRYFPEGATSNRAATIICDSPSMTMGYFNIFGMHHRCNAENADMVDPRKFDTEAERIRALLPELISHMGSSPTHIQVGSNLWDLSAGCNHQLGITDYYQELYVTGIHQIHAVLTELFPYAHISWRTGMPIHSSYDAMAKGRKLVNQEALNELVKQEVQKSNQTIGVFLDHWSVVRSAPTDCCMMKDGRHYPTCSSFAFMNNWLDSIYTPDGNLVTSSS